MIISFKVNLGYGLLILGFLLTLNASVSHSKSHHDKDSAERGVIGVAAALGAIGTGLTLRKLDADKGHNDKVIKTDKVASSNKEASRIDDLHDVGGIFVKPLE